jgi:general secretion pathway protein G
MSQSVKRGFTLVEILIVVVIMGILAAIVVPQFHQSSDDARYSAVIQNLQSLRQQIDLYKNQHRGQLPGTPGGAAPDTLFVDQLTKPTNEAGEVGDFGDPNYPLGPYITTLFPANPFNHSRTVESVTTLPDSAPAGTTVNSGDPGWIYEVTTGRIKINWGGTTPDGQNYWDL